jgi:hypothetical protein
LDTRCVFVQNFNFLIFLDIQICCFKDFEFLLDENVLCNRVFNGTFGALSLPASYEIVFERLGFPDDHSQPLLIDFLFEEAVQKSPDESLFDFLANNLKKTSYSNSPGLFIQQFQAVNSSNIALAKIEKAENDYFGEYLDELLWNKQQNVILVLTSRSCGYCDVAKRYENLGVTENSRSAPVCAGLRRSAPVCAGLRRSVPVCAGPRRSAPVDKKLFFTNN